MPSRRPSPPLLVFALLGLGTLLAAAAAGAQSFPCEAGPMTTQERAWSSPIWYAP